MQGNLVVSALCEGSETLTEKILKRCDQPTDLLTEVDARDACASKNKFKSYSYSVDKFQCSNWDQILT